MKRKLVFMLVVAVILFFPTIIMAKGSGPEFIELDGGKKGTVTLPHHTHQQVLKDCNKCHAVFPKKRGSIQALKAEKKLKNKFVMNKLCIKCHRKEKKAGRKAGPVKCSACHTRR